MIIRTMDERWEIRRVYCILFMLFSADKLEEGLVANEEGEKSIWDALVSGPQEALDMIMDPNKREREEEEKTTKEVKAAKKAWRAIRKERFPFLDDIANDEKKVSE